MEKNKILHADVLDIIFDGKNKAYGAYQLRRAYKKTLTKALAITATALVLVISGTVLAGLRDKSTDGRVFNTVETVMVDVKEDVPPPPPPPLTPPPAIELNQVRFTPPIVVDDIEVAPDEKIEEITEVTAIANETVKSDNKIQIIQAPVEIANTQIMEIRKPDNENEIFTKVEKEAGFPGGEDAWRNYLRNTLNANTPIDNGAPAGKYTVIVKFVVSKDGSLSDIKCDTDPGFGMCEEAIRVIKKTKSWIPALQNGSNVNAYRRQPIVFLVQE